MHLAQINIAKARGLLTSPVMAEFADAIDRINQLAEAAPGFVWRLKDSGNALAIQVFDDPLLVVNMSVWESVDALRSYTYVTEHVQIMRRRREWFERSEGPHLALWWTPEGSLPTPQEGKARLEYLGTHGPTPHAFTFAQPFELVFSYG